LFDQNIKLSLSSSANKALDSVNDGHWEDVFGTTENNDGDRLTKSPSTGPTIIRKTPDQGFAPHSPHCTVYVD